MPTILALGFSRWTDPAQALIAGTVLTFLAMIALAAASMWLKHWICHRDKYMKRRKPLIEELYAVATGVVALCFVTAMQFLLLGDVVEARPGIIELQTTKLPLVGKLSILTIISLAVVVIMASARTRLARIEMTLALDESGDWIPTDLESAMPRLKKLLILMVSLSVVLGEFYLVANVFASNVQLLRY